MRKWLSFGAVAVVLAGGSAWYFGWWQKCAPGEPVLPIAHFGVRKAPTVHLKPDDNAEPADTIEPLVVENSVPAPVTPASLPELEAPPVYLTPDITQAPRPDTAPRMAYLDEVLILPWPLEPWARLLQEFVLSQLKRAEGPPAVDRTEEAENKDVNPPVEPPLPLQTPDYHHQYPSCPYTGGHCPIPYPYYPRR